MMAGEIETNEKGGQQSKLATRCDLLDGYAMVVLASVLKEGAEKYDENNWRLIGERSHVNHALEHLFRYLAADLSGDTDEDHLAHAFCRMMMAVAMRERSYADSPEDTPGRHDGVRKQGG